MMKSFLNLGGCSRSRCPALSRPLGLVFAALLGSAPMTSLEASPPMEAADTVPKPAPKPVRKPNVVAGVAKKLADTLGTAGAAKVLDTLLGAKGKAVGQMLGAGGATPCALAGGVGPGVVPGLALPGVATAGTQLVGIAKKAARRTNGDSATSPVPAMPCPNPMAGADAAALQAAAATQAMGGAQLGAPGGLAGTAMMATPLGMAVTAAPLATAGVGAAAKGMKKLLGGGPMSAMAMLKEVEGKGHLVLRGVQFVAHTEVLDDGYEAPLTTLAEALSQVPGPYALYVEPEAEKGGEPELKLAEKRMAKIWATLVASGVSAKVFVSGVAVPASLVKGRKPAKPGNALVELWKIKEVP